VLVLVLVLDWYINLSVSTVGLGIFRRDLQGRAARGLPGFSLLTDFPLLVKLFFSRVWIFGSWTISQELVLLAVVSGIDVGFGV
jgi:hypothetical protein